ncbi:MAG: class I SAM-dependent methyltransferase [Candidatus Riflebacteria bacterium]|nr:class I SAM-dependent methyltransferase [Candidatus Riflebacteria bacterium]
MTENPIKALLLDLNIISADSIEDFFPTVRDRDDFKVLRCKKSGVIFLTSTNSLSKEYYTERSDYSYWKFSSRQEILHETMVDNQRRAKQLAPVISRKRWLDFGTGVGGILPLLSPIAVETWGLEPQNKARQDLIDLGFKMVKEIEELPDDHFNVITLFHVFEHLSDPIQELKRLQKKMAQGGKIIIEIPHARDFLISFLKCDAFKKFSFWSEHLILHTRQSLERFLQEAGLKNIVIEGFQRFPLANHLHWLTQQKPGGHEHWQFLRAEDLDEAYSSMLAKLDYTDTLLAFAQKE